MDLGKTLLTAVKRKTPSTFSIYLPLGHYRSLLGIKTYCDLLQPSVDSCRPLLQSTKNQKCSSLTEDEGRYGAVQGEGTRCRVVRTHT